MAVHAILTIGKLMTNVPGYPTFTLGYVILTSAPEIAPDVLSHELGHVTQYGILGSLFLPSYGIAHSHQQ